jgi:cytochrome b561
MMARPAFVKWFRWLGAGLILGMCIFNPAEGRADPGGALSAHAGVGIALGLTVALWISMYSDKAMAGPAGAKIPATAKHISPWRHTYQ